MCKNLICYSPDFLAIKSIVESKIKLFEENNPDSEPSVDSVNDWIRDAIKEFGEVVKECGLQSLSEDTLKDCVSKEFIQSSIVSKRDQPPEDDSFVDGNNEEEEEYVDD